MTQTSLSMNEFMISLKDLASALGISIPGLHKYMKQNGLSTVLVGAKAYVSPEEVNKLMQLRKLVIKKQIISLQMLKGGVAKTTTALNLAIRANMYGAKVLLVDLDQQANLSFAFSIEDPDAKVWADIVEGKALIASTIRHVSSTLHLIPSNLNNSMLERLLLNGKRNLGECITEHLRKVRSEYDLIIIDTAPNISAINTAASCASDIVLLPVMPDKFSLSGLKKTLDDLREIKKEFRAHFEPKILFTKFDGRETASHELLKLCYADYSDFMLKAFVRVSSDAKNVIRSGKTIYDNKSAAKEDYDLVTREILQMTQ